MRLMLLACLLLIIIIFAESFFGMPESGKPEGVPGAVGPTAVEVAPTGPPAPELLIEWAAHVSARPLFSPTRRPSAAEADQAARSARPPRLSGLVLWPGHIRAILQLDEDTRVLVASEGESLGEWTVEAIGADGVAVRRGGKRIVLRVTFASSAGPTLPPPAQSATRGRDPWGRHFRVPSFLERRK